MKHYETGVNYIFYDDRIVEFYDNYEKLTAYRENPNKIGLLQGKRRKNEINYYSKKLIEKRLTTWLKAIELYNIYWSHEKKKNQRKPIFLTLTLSGIPTYTHQEIQRLLLQNFIKQIKYTYSIKEIFWKAELQKNQRIHYHIVTDHYMPAKEIQLRWNMIQRKHGLTKEYERKYRKENPPSTHVRMIAEMEKAIAYVMKYVTKKEDNGEIKSNLYRFSSGLTKLKPFSYSNTFDHVPEMIPWLKSNANSDYSTDYYTVIRMKEKINPDTMPKKLRTMYLNYYRNIYEALYCS